MAYKSLPYLSNEAKPHIFKQGDCHAALPSHQTNSSVTSRATHMNKTILAHSDFARGAIQCFCTDKALPGKTHLLVTCFSRYSSTKLYQE